MRLLLRRATRAMSQQHVWIIIALVLDAVIAVTGIITGPGFNMIGLLAVGPLLACARCNGPMTALVAAYALTLCAVVAADTGTIGSRMQGYRIGMVAVAGALAVLVAVVRDRRESTLIKISERVQHAILRPLPDLDAAVKRVVRLLLEHSGDGLTDDVLLVLGEQLATV